MLDDGVDERRLEVQARLGDDATGSPSRTTSACSVCDTVKIEL